MKAPCTLAEGEQQRTGLWVLRDAAHRDLHKPFAPQRERGVEPAVRANGHAALLACKVG